MGKRGGYQPGGGRPKGAKNKTTLEKEAVLSAVKQRIMGMAGKLIDAQASLAQGLTYLYVIRTVEEGKKQVKQKPELVTDPGVIEDYLAGELDGNEDEYYYITTKEPNNQAIDSLFNRTFGKPKESLDVDLSSKGQPISGITIVKPEEPQDVTGTEG